MFQVNVRGVFLTWMKQASGNNILEEVRGWANWFENLECFTEWEAILFGGRHIYHQVSSHNLEITKTTRSWQEEHRPNDPITVTNITIVKSMNIP